MFEVEMGCVRRITFRGALSIFFTEEIEQRRPPLSRAGPQNEVAVRPRMLHG
jgi:hypothetical protein